MKKHTASKVSRKQPNWQRKVLGQAIAMAGAGLQASAALAACPTSPVNAAITATCLVTTGQTATITSTGSIIVSGAGAIDIIGGGAVDNSGTLTGSPWAISAAPTAGAINITNHAGGAINGATVAILLGGGGVTTLTNGGTIKAEHTNGGSGLAEGVVVVTLGAGSSITNDGTISGHVVGASSVSAQGIFISALAGSVTNNTNGTISATANAAGTFTNESAFAEGLAIESFLAGGTITNAGTISADATATSTVGATVGTNNVYASAVGVDFGGVFTSSTSGIAGKLTNSGTISATAKATAVAGNAAGFARASATGIYVRDNMLSTAAITNNGTINATATSTDYAEAIGIYVGGSLLDGEGGATITNSANHSINVKATGTSVTATGIYIGGTIASGASVTNAGTIKVEGFATAAATNQNAYASVAGIWVGRDIAGVLSNSGAIDVTAKDSGSNPAGFDGAEAFGIYVSGNIAATGSITNDTGGTITATATGDGPTAMGIYVSRDMLSSELSAATITNKGTITATAHGQSSAYAAGIYVSSTMQNRTSITNAGTITVEADAATGSAYADGIFVSRMANGSSITNSGTITVTAKAGNSESSEQAAGIYVRDMSSGATITVTNTGTITADTSNGVGMGYAIYVNSGNSGAPGMITNDGKLFGNVYLNGASLNNNNLLSIPVHGQGFARNSSYINGNYTQSATGVLEIGAFSAQKYGQLEVTGVANIAASGKFAVMVAPLDQLHAGDVLQNVLHASGTLTDNPANFSVTDNSAFWDFTAVDDGENGIDLKVAGHTVPVLAAQSVQVANVNLDELSGIVMGRMDTRRMLIDRGAHDQNLWFRPYGTKGSQDNSNGIPGYDIDTYGMVIGYDNNVSDDWNVGAAFAYSKADIKAKGALNDKVNTDYYQGAVYGYWTGSEHTFMDLMAIMGSSNNNSTRDLGPGAPNADGNYNGWYTRLSSAFGKGFPLSDKFMLTPIASVSYTYVKEDSYKEKGAGGSNLAVDNNDASSLIFGVDGQLSYEISKGALLTAHIGGGYDALTDNTSVTSNFVGGGAPFSTKGNKPNEWLGRAGVGTEIVASDRIEVHVNYEYEYRDKFTDNLLTATLRWKI